MIKHSYNDTESPILMAPVGVQSIFHEDKETGLSEVCSEIGVPYILSTASSSSIEEVAKANGKGPRLVSFSLLSIASKV
jgi:lactate 2-monooxygenase